MLAGKQSWQMPFQAVVRGAQTLMRVVWVACFLVHTAFVQEGGILLVPAFECRFKRRLSALVNDRARSACAAGLLGFLVRWRTMIFIWWNWHIVKHLKNRNGVAPPDRAHKNRYAIFMGTRRTICTACGGAPCYAFLSIQLYLHGYMANVLNYSYRY